MIRVALAQINPIVGDLLGNKEKILNFIALAKGKEADVVVFPEMALCGYPPEDLLLKPQFVKDNLKVLNTLVKSVSGITAIVGFVDQNKEGNFFNAAAVISDKKWRGVYHKQELPNYGVFDEKRYFKPGQESKNFSIDGTPFGLNICEDIWVKDLRCAPGVSILFAISCSPYENGKIELRQRIVKDKARRLKAFVCYTNLVGGQDELIFDGGSFITNPKGRVIALAKQFEEDLLVADLDVGSDKSTKSFRLQRHFYSKLSALEQIYRALILGTRDYVRKNGFQKVIVGVSGGIDSALVAIIAAEALGPQNVIAVTMPSRFTSKETNQDAKKLVENLGIEVLEIPIEAIFESYLRALQQVFKSLEPNIAEENIQARIRGNILMAISNKFGWLVLTTGNKSEFSVGYCTLYGDMSGGFAVLKDLSKTKVFELARFINVKKVVIPQSIIDRPPSAELKLNQKDQDTLPPYDILDKVLEQYIEKHRFFTVMRKEYPEELLKKILLMVDHSEYKRRQSPPGVKLTPRAFGKDWRLPITNKYKEF